MYAQQCTLGVRVIPELPQPGNAGNGWQFPGGEELVVCRNMEPWHNYCEEPPCGQVRSCILKNVQLAVSYKHMFQLNPTKEKVFEILGKIYQEFFNMFEFDSFHMGGNNVKSECWKTNPDILAYMDNDPKLRSKDDNG